MSKILKKIFLTFCSLGLLLGLLILSILWVFSNNLPDYKFLINYKPPVSSKVYSGEGELVSDFSSEKRIFVPYNAIPAKVVNAFLSSEDKNFFSHPGVDAKGVLRAIINNIQNVKTLNVFNGGGWRGRNLFSLLSYNAMIKKTDPYELKSQKNIIINKKQINMDTIEIPKHWNLSDRHKLDIKKFINAYYENLHTFFGIDS